MADWQADPIIKPDAKPAWNADPVVVAADFDPHAELRRLTETPEDIASGRASEAARLREIADREAEPWWRKSVPEQMAENRRAFDAAPTLEEKLRILMYNPMVGMAGGGAIPRSPKIPAISSKPVTPKAAPAATKAAPVAEAGAPGPEAAVAREAADLVLVNDSFSVIVAAIEEGRRLLDNLKKM